MFALCCVFCFAFIVDCNWPVQLIRTRNARNQSELDKQTHSEELSTNQLDNYIDCQVLVKLELDYNSKPDTDIERNSMLHWEYWPKCPIGNDLDHRNFLVDVQQLAMLHSKLMLMMDRRNHTIEDQHSLDFAIEQDSTVTMLDYWFVNVVDWIGNAFVPVDWFVD